MVQMIIRNAKVENEIIKLVDSVEKSTIEVQKLAFGNGKAAIEVQKLAIEILKSAIEERKYKEPTQKKLIQIYETIEANQIFGTNEVVRVLNCAPSTARELMSKLREMDVVCVVKGKGKGKYRFLNEDEIKN